MGRLEALEIRLAKLEGSKKNQKCPGVVKKLRREIKNLKND